MDPLEGISFQELIFNHSHYHLLHQTASNWIEHLDLKQEHIIIWCTIHPFILLLKTLYLDQNQLNKVQKYSHTH